MALRPIVAAPFLCMAATGTLAQSSLSISGLIDIGLYRDTNKVWQLGPIQRSNILFSGVEDLGGGLAATFALNLRFEPDTGQLEQTNKPFFYGESTVGLRGSLGAIRLGRALDSMESHDYQFDAWDYYDRIASPAWDLWHYNYPTDPLGNGNNTPEYGRVNNGVFYDSPSIAGFTLHLNAAFKEDVRGLPPGTPPMPGTPDGQALRQSYGASLLYNSEHVNAMVAHERNSFGDTDTFLGLNGMLGSLTVYGALDRSETALTGSVAKVATLSAKYIIDRVTLRAGWGQLDLDGTMTERIASLGVAYAFSKRTSVYVDAASKRYVDDTRSMYGVGIAHSF